MRGNIVHFGAKTSIRFWLTLKTLNFQFKDSFGKPRHCRLTNWQLVNTYVINHENWGAPRFSHSPKYLPTAVQISKKKYIFQCLRLEILEKI